MIIMAQRISITISSNLFDTLEKIRDESIGRSEQIESLIQKALVWETNTKNKGETHENKKQK